jgi:hypothetical protein
MATFQLEKTDKGVFAHLNGDQKRTIKCPDKQAERVVAMYYPSKMTILKYNIPVLNVDGQERQCHDTVLKRIWQSLWEEGWRRK